MSPDDWTPRVVTVTLDPSLDTTSTIDQVEPNTKLRTAAVRHDPGGGGLNVTRAMKTLGAGSTALWTKGGPFGNHVAELLDERGVDHAPIAIEDRTKQSFAVVEESTGDQYRFSEPGPALTRSERKALLGQIERRSCEWLVLSGGTSPAMSKGLHAEIAEIGAKGGARIVLDTHGETLHRAVAGGNVSLVKPNLRELEELAGTKLEPKVSSVTNAAREVFSDYDVAVVVSLGSAGAVLVTDESSELIEAPEVEVESRIGAGDAMVAGIVTSLVHGESLLDAARHGVAAGTAAVLTPATRLCRREDVESILQAMT